MGIKELLSWLNPFAVRSSAETSLIPFGFSSYQGKSYKYETYAQEGYQINSVVFSCIGKIIQSMQTVEWAYERDGERIEEDQLSPQLQILNNLLDNPDPYTTRNELIAEYILHLHIGGIAYIRYINVRPDQNFGSDRLGTAPELILERPDRVEIKTVGREVLGYRVQRTNGVDNYTPDEMIFIRLPNPLKHLSGQPPMQACALEIDALNAGRKLNVKTLADGGVLKSIIALKGQRNVAHEKMQEIIGQFWERYDKAKTEGKPFVFNGDGADFHTLSQTMSELDWSSNEGIMARRICNVFNVPSQLIGDPDTSKYSNYKEALKDFYVNNILPETRSLLTKLNGWLVPIYDPGNIKIIPDASGVEVLQRDIADMTEWMAKATWMTPNEKRLRMGLEPSDSEGADEIGQQSNKNAVVQIDDRSMRSAVIPLDHIDERSMFRTEASRAAESRRKDNIRQRKEKQFKAGLDKYFSGQRDRLIEAFIDATGGKRSKRASEEEPLLIKLEEKFVANTFERISENAKYVEDMHELTRGIVVDFGQDAIDQFVKEGVLFDIERPAMQEFIADDLAIRSEIINNTQAETLQRVIEEGYNKGYSQNKIANLITDKYDEIKSGRAKTIARTEVGRAAGIATQEGFRQAGVVYKEWLSARDGNVRDDEHSHTYMDGQVVSISDPFVGAGGETSMTVPPTSGVPGFDINCRCVSVPLETEDDAI